MQSEYYRCKSSQNWENYRKYRNLVVKLRKKSIKNYYMQTRCSISRDSKEFWRNIKPLISDKAQVSVEQITLLENYNNIKT